MATALRHSLKVISSKVIQKSFQVSAVSKFVYAQKISTRGLTLNTNIGCAVSNRGVVQKSLRLSKASAPCGCCSYHSEGDQRLVHFLLDEIALAKRTEQMPPKIAGWISKTDGSGVVLTKQINDETIKVEFDVNHSVESEGFAEDGKEPAAESDVMVSRPPFEVKIIKKSGETLRFLCEFPDQDMEYEVEENNDQFSIVEVHLDKESKDSEGFENSYTHSGSVMDPVLYDSLMDMLDERGVGNKFITDMVNFSTTYEHKLYVQFLEKLKQFVSE